MAGHGRDMAYTAGEITGQAQMKKDEDDFFNQASNPSHGGLNRASDYTLSGQNPTITTQATNFLQQTGEQVKNIAQGAADAVKSTLGMHADNHPNNPSSPSFYTSNPNTTNFDSSIPNTTNFDTSIPNTTNFDSSIPNTTNFDTSIPNTTNFDTSIPNTTNFNSSSPNHPSRNPANRRNI